MSGERQKAQNSALDLRLLLLLAIPRTKDHGSGDSGPKSALFGLHKGSLDSKAPRMEPLGDMQLNKRAPQLIQPDPKPHKARDEIMEVL